MIDVSVIIVNMNTRELLRESLRSVFQSSVPKEVIVVDNASSDGSVEMVQQEFREVRLIRNNMNERFAKPNNDAMKIARGRYIFLLNSDAALKIMALELLVAYMDKNPNVGMCGPQLLNPDGSIQPSCKGFVSLWTHVCDIFLLDRLFPNSHVFAGSEMTFFDHNADREVDHVMAAAVIVRSEIVRDIGMFDERLSICYNDLDWSYRIKKSGWKIIFYPRAQVVHHSGQTVRPVTKDSDVFREQYENVLYYYEKHFGRITAIFYRLFLVIGFVPRMLYWHGRLIVDRSDRVGKRAQSSVRTFIFALPLWRTANSHDKATP
ncbi:MAG: glycosyltransferase family 2 protein [Candidatus Eisenbacteria bacterium]|nr:glycosyltransferase family 2 protein [Candidatus Eisenbacteria bacterium]